MNHRRTLLAALGGLALASDAFAQQAAKPPGKTWRVGVLSLSTAASSSSAHAAFVQGLSELGYAEGGNLVIEKRYAAGDHAQLGPMAAELVQLKVDLITASGNDATLAAQKASSTIPIVMFSTSDPVGNGIVQSLARPGGNVTGISDMSGELGPKRLEMLIAITAPSKLTQVAVLANLASPGNVKALAQVQAAGSSVGVKILPVDARTPEQIDNAFASMKKEKVGGVIVLPNPIFVQQRSQIALLGLHHRLPVSAPYGVFAEAGCLMSYGSKLVANLRLAATYVDKIFKGTKPADLPVEQPTTYELFINGKTAKALGLTIPHGLLILADKVIE